VLTKANAVG